LLKQFPTQNIRKNILRIREFLNGIRELQASIPCSPQRPFAYPAQVSQSKSFYNRIRGCASPRSVRGAASLETKHEDDSDGGDEGFQSRRGGDYHEFLGITH